MSRILVVEDEVPLVRLIGWFLVEAGHETVIVPTVGEASPRLHNGDIGIVVCNSGISADEKRRTFVEWRVGHPELRIVDVARPPKVGRTYIDTGADEHLMMPFHADDLIRAVAAAR